MIKNWLAHTFFKAELLEAERQGGMKAFPLASKDILETMRDDLDKQAEELAQEKLSKLLSVVDPRKVISFSERQKSVFIGGEQVTDAIRLQNLKSEAEMLLTSDLWAVLQETPKRLAEKAMFEDDGKLETQLLKGRAILYMLDTQKRILATLTSYTHA